MEIIELLGANPDASFVVEHNLLSKESSQKLAEYMESSLRTDEDPIFPFGHENVYKKKLDAHGLADLIGHEDTLRLVDFFQEHRGKDDPITEIYLARHSPSTEEATYYTPWHKDSYSAVEIQLGDFEEGEEWLAHLTREGTHTYTGWPGTAMVHGQDIAHGTPPFFGDEPKYLLVLKHHPKDTDNKHPKEAILTKEIVEQVLAK